MNAAKELLQASTLIMSAKIRIVYSLLFLAVISALAAHRIYRDTIFRFQPETKSLRLLYAGSHNTLKSHELHEMRSNSKQNLRVEDLVLFPENELLLLISLPSLQFIDFLPPKSNLGCLFSSKLEYPVLGIEILQRKAAIRCKIPSEWDSWAANNQITLVLNGSPMHGLGFHKAKSFPMKWGRMIYETVITDTDVILFAKGINPRQGISTAPETLRCVFNSTVETAVTVSAQEIFRCANPPKHLRAQLSGTKISLKAAEKSQFPIPSVAYYQNPRFPVSKFDENPKKFLCACTMVFNAAKFLKEWVIYHSFLGVESFFIYDNNSEDNLKQVIESLSDYNVCRQPWPWPKTQEAGFAYCALQARDKCHWMMFTDVDEFVFSHQWLKSDPPPSNALQNLVLNKTMQGLNSSSSIIGQVSLKCRDFGPSGLKKHPPGGLTQGYICRQKQEYRHKSIVMLDAISASLLNAVHHFELKPGYRSLKLKSWEGVINHYKYQVWSEFKTKFRRRVSAYVVDWKESKNPLSQDRAPGLGYEAIEPPGWEKRFCQVNDTALKQFSTKVFSVENGSTSMMLWEL